MNLTHRLTSASLCVLAAVAAFVVGGCGAGQEQKDRGFSTSGNREADQRAEQRMAKAEQLAGGNDNGGQKIEKSTGAAVAEDKKTLYNQLGGQQGITAIVDDVVTRWLADPQVNFERKGVTKGGWGFSRGASVAWQPDATNVPQIKKNLVDYLALKTGGPTTYNGPEFTTIAQDKHVTNPEFDAAVGDLKTSLDKFKIANDEQKQVLAIMESNRPMIVTER